MPRDWGQVKNNLRVWGGVFELAAATAVAARPALQPQEWDALLSDSAALPLWLAELLSEQAP